MGTSTASLIPTLDAIPSVLSSAALTPPGADEPAGYRFQALVTADGSEDTVVTPLTARDTLHPEEGDHISQDVQQVLILVYLVGLLTHLATRTAGLTVFADLRFEFDDPDIDPLVPDILFVENAGEYPMALRTYNFRVRSGRPILALEVVSKNSRNNDLVDKKAYYRQLGIENYIVIDRVSVGGPADRVHGYRLNDKGEYEDIPLVDGGIVLSPLNARLGLGSHDGVVLHDATTGREIPYLEQYAIEAEEHQRATIQFKRQLTANAQRIFRLIRRAKRNRDAHRAAEASKIEAERRVAEEIAARKSAEAAKEAAEAAKEAAEAAKEAAEQRAEAMQRELDELRRQSKLTTSE